MIDDQKISRFPTVREKTQVEIHLSVLFSFCMLVNPQKKAKKYDCLAPLGRQGNVQYLISEAATLTRNFGKLPLPSPKVKEFSYYYINFSIYIYIYTINLLKIFTHRWYYQQTKERKKKKKDNYFSIISIILFLSLLKHVLLGQKTKSTAHLPDMFFF